jgi:hypothetical protein
VGGWCDTGPTAALVSGLWEDERALITVVSLRRDGLGGRFALVDLTHCGGSRRLSEGDGDRGCLHAAQTDTKKSASARRRAVRSAAASGGNRVQARFQRIQRVFCTLCSYPSHPVVCYDRLR